jgi:3-oxoacyl-[acyl-carrier protein] reductase
MAGPLNGKVAVVTGGSRGIGRAISVALAADGAAVVINYAAKADAASATVRAIRDAGGRAESLLADIADPTSAARLFSAAEQAFGPVDILVCNAGVAAVIPLPEVSEADYERIFGVNARSLVFLLQAAARSLSNHGRIITLSSTIAAYPRSGMALYAASKAAVRALTEVAAIELGPRGITANCVLPGMIETDMIALLPPEHRKVVAESSPFNRIGMPDDITGIVRFLASEESRWVTGQSILANGGARR